MTHCSPRVCAQREFVWGHLRRSYIVYSPAGSDELGCEAIQMGIYSVIMHARIIEWVVSIYISDEWCAVYSMTH